MPYTIDKLPNEPIIVIVHKSSNFMPEMEALIKDMTPLIEAQAEPVFLLIDIRDLSLSLEDVTVGGSAVGRGQGALLHHPNVRESLLISTSGLIKLGAAGMRTATFGNVNIKVFDTQDLALEYCRERIAETAGKSANSAAS